MSFCSNRYILPTIELEELIGKSLNTINTNFSLISKQTCSEDLQLKEIQNIYSSLQHRINSLGEELRGSPIAYVLFDGLGNSLRQKRISSVNRTSVGIYRISFSSPINSPYLVVPSAVSFYTIQISIIDESVNSVIVASRQQNGTLIDPEKISLTFFT
jgi:hypothetical protein